MRVWDGINRYLAFRLKELEFRIQTWKRSREISRAYDTPSTRRQQASSANFYTLRLRIMAVVKLVAVALALFLVGFGAVKLVEYASSAMTEHAEKKAAAPVAEKPSEADKAATEAEKKAAAEAKKAAAAEKKAAAKARKAVEAAEKKAAAAVKKAAAAEKKAAAAAQKAVAAAEKKAAAAAKKAADAEKKAAAASGKAAAAAEKKAAEAAKKAADAEKKAAQAAHDSGTGAGDEPEALETGSSEPLPGLSDDSGLPETAVLPEGYADTAPATAASAPTRPAAPAQPADKLLEAFMGAIPRGMSDRLILVNKAAKEMYLLNASPNGWSVARTFPVATGENDGRKVVEGDKKTPEGVYFIVGRKHKSELTHMYGPAAFITDYPNEQDRRERRTGHGIWIHGSERGNLPPFFTQGCVATSNPEILTFASLLGKEWAGTPVIIVSGEEEAKKHLASVDFAAMKARRNEVVLHYGEKQAEFEKLVSDWKMSWESRDIDRYSSFYLTSSFMEGSTKWDAFRDRKNRLFNAYSAIYVDLSNITLTEYTDNAATVKFHQVYNTNVGNKMENAKRLIFKKDQGNWKIYREIPFPKEELL